MSDAPRPPRKKLVFLHIPKTAGQSVRAALRRVFGRERLSPVVVVSQGRPFGTCFPQTDRYDFFSGHLDWHDLDARIPQPRCVFTVLREPRERIASFYFFQLDHAEKHPELLASSPGLQLVQSVSVDDFFCNPDVPARAHIDEMYDNFQTHYLATKRVHRGRAARLTDAALLATAVANARALDLVCTTDRLDRVEQLVRAEFGREITLTATFVNRGRIDPAKSRHAELTSRIKDKRTLDRIAEFSALDEQLIRELGLA